MAVATGKEREIEWKKRKRERERELANENKGSKLVWHAKLKLKTSTTRIECGIIRTERMNAMEKRGKRKKKIGQPDCG